MATRLQKFKRRITRRKRANAHLMYLENVKPINQKTSNGCTLEEAYDPNESMPEFALLSIDGKQIGSWMKCKDYIQDCIWGGKFGKSYDCHGFYYNHGRDPLPNLDNLHLAVRYSDPKYKQKLSDMLENIKGTVEDLEERIKIPKKERTRFSRVINDEFDYFVVYGSRHWLKATHTISFFTFLLRASFLNSGKKIDTIGTTPPVKKDAYYYQSGRKYMEMLSKSGIKALDSNWKRHSKHDDPYSVHGDGFVAWSAAAGQEDIPEGTIKDDDWEF